MAKTREDKAEWQRQWYAANKARQAVLKAQRARDPVVVAARVAGEPIAITRLRLAADARAQDVAAGVDALRALPAPRNAGGFVMRSLALVCLTVGQARE
jgi:hypothetical protein